MRKHACPVCTGRLSSERKLVEHVLRTHLLGTSAIGGANRYRCWCGRDSVFRGAMELHFEKHGGVQAHYLEVALGVNDA